MIRISKLALGGLLSAVVLAGCSDWLTGSKLTNNPNSPNAAGRNQLLVGVEVGQTIIQTGDLARLFSMWTQQVQGVARQAASYGVYNYDEDAFSPDWTQIYTGGGLIDIRSMDSNAIAAGDSIFAGVGLSLEAMTVGAAADVWGDIPYSQAVSDSFATPALDPQLQVYATIQAKLDTAIRYLQCDTAVVTTCIGPGTSDLWYGGDRAKWLEAAHTLKARYYMHTAEVDPTSYGLALAQTDSGISTPDNDMLSFQSDNPNENNLWFQFMVIQRAGDIAAGAFLVNLLKANSDPRLQAYFAPNGSGDFLGSAPGGGSEDFSTLSDARLDPSFRQPLLTFAENQLIRAEAALHEGQTGVALAAFNAERTSQGVPTKTSISLTDVITEKYIALFQNGLEVWNDYKRTCLPKLTPAKATGIPGRVLYPLSAERNTNPNVPPPDQQPARNANDPNPCP
ncbi:MAG TPA: SusD/RagB family nutrient-binding outer membrane lipoprotein [Gemmatimonadaceae bacterium]|nr:SusD/RagB family nutrient-binding outer membrane lipoprotein [Gemmatimonadaceae bacterium]